MSAWFARNFFRSLTLGLVLLATADILIAQVQDLAKPIWTASLKIQGYHHYSARAATQTLIGDVAATKETVAVMLAIRNQRNEKGGWTGPWDVYLVIYATKTGQFLSKKGPWKSNSPSQLAATPNDQLLLILEVVREPNQNPRRHLLLLSPLGEQVKELKLALEYDEEKPKPQYDYLLLSPSGSTILDVNKWEGGQTYRIVETNSLSVRREWTEKQHGKEIVIAGISDNCMLGRTHYSYEIREFNGDWKQLPNFDPPPANGIGMNLINLSKSFISTDLIAGQIYETKDGFVWHLFGTDGSMRNKFVAPRLPNYNWFSPVASNSQDGLYVGLRMQHENMLTHWWDHTMDMWPAGASYFLYVWSTKSSSAIARIKVSEKSGRPSFFPPGTAEIAIVDDGTLKAFSLPTNSAPN
jgi:hypothetical protein